jgi:hypothetical protein
MHIFLLLALSWISYAGSGFSLEKPTAWKTESLPGKVIFGSGEARLVVRTEKAASLAAWAQNRKQTQTLPDGSSRVQKTSDTRLAGLPAKRLVLFGFDRQVLEEAVFRKGVVYVLEYDLENPNDPKFSEHQAIYAKMRSSFKLR